MNEGMFKYATTEPCATPIAAPTNNPTKMLIIVTNQPRRPMDMFAKSGGSMMACTYAATALTKPVAFPADKSMLPVTMTNTMLIAKNDTIVIWRKRFDMFCGLKKIQFVR